MLVVRREHARHESKIHRIAGHLTEPIVKNTGYRADYRDFEVTAEDYVARWREQLRILSIDWLIIRVQ